MSAVRFRRTGIDRFELSGVLSFDTVPDLAPRGRELFRDGNEVVTVDLSGVERSDSAGLALLVGWSREAVQYNAKLRLVNMPPQMLAIARVSSLDGILPLGRE